MTVHRAVWAVVVTALLGLASLVASPPADAVPACTSAGGGSGYTVGICITAPAPGATLSGTQPVSASVTTVGMPSGTRVSGVVFCHDVTSCPSHAPGYLITDFVGTAAGAGQKVYSFDLDTRLFADISSMTLYAYAEVNDGTVTTPAGVTVGIANGQSAPSPIATGFAAHTAPANDGTVVGAVGDGAGGEPGETAVANLISSWTPAAFLYLGDVYDKGSPSEFTNWYDKYGYGDLKSVTDPTVGNHEYSASDTAEGYFRYWRSPPHYYSFDAGGWHFISLDANSQFGTSVPGVDQDLPSTVTGVTTQYDWLQSDLGSHAGACTVVYWHQPVWNQGGEPRSTRMQPIWSLLARKNVTLVLNGHDHDYQRYAALDANGSPKPTGVTEIIAGGGGHSSQVVVPGSQPGPNPITYATGFAAMRLVLHPDRVDYSAIAPDTAPDGRTIDAGSVPCQAQSQDKTPPSAPVASATTKLASNLASVNVSWRPSTDNRGVASYQVFRNGTAISPLLSSTSTAFSDDTVATSTTYSYTVKAKDGWGNSATSAPVQVTTPSATGAPVAVDALADTYVSSSSPTPKGSATRLRVQQSSSNTSVTYLKFDLRRLTGQIANASLQLDPAASTSLNATAWPVADTSWSESTLGWPGPAIGTTAGGTTNGVTQNVPVSLDVTNLVTSGAISSLALAETSGTTQQSFYSKEDSSGTAPHLIVSLVAPPDTTAPTVPGNVTASAQGENEVTVNWSASTDDSGVDHYVIYRGGAALDTVPAPATSYVDPSASGGTTYHFAVSAVDAAGNESAPSPDAVVTTPDLSEPEWEEQAVALATSATTASVYWEAAEDNVAVTGYRLYRDGNLQATVDDSTLRWRDTGLTPGQTYTYSVSAFDAAGNATTPSSETADPITTPDTSADVTPPTVPSAPAVTGGGSTVQLTWAGSTDDVEVAGYTIFEDGLPVAATSDTSYTSDVSSLDTHSWRVDAFDAAGNHSAWSPATTAAFGDSGPSPVDDAAYVQSGTSADNNYKWATALKVSGGFTPKVTYVKFSINTANALSVIDHVYLTLTTDQTSNPGFDVYVANGTAWTRQTITWNNQPGYSGPVVASSGPVTASGTVPTPPGAIDLAGMVSGYGTHSVALVATGSASQAYSSDVDAVPVTSRPSVEVVSHS